MKQPKAWGPIVNFVSMLFIVAILLPLALLSYSTILGGSSPNIDFPLRDELAQSSNKLAHLCGKSEKLFEVLSDAQHSFYDEGSNVLGSTFFTKNTYSRQAYVSNGYIGARISTLGQGFSYDEINIHSISQDETLLLNGWPLFNRRYTGAFAAGFYSLQSELAATNFPELAENGYDTIISSLPYWAQLNILMEDESGEVHKFEPSTVQLKDITNYNQNMSLQNGIVSTSLIWLNQIEIKIEIMTHKQILPLGLINMHLRPLHTDLNVTVQDVLNLTTSKRTTLQSHGVDDDGIYMVVNPDNVPYSSGAVYSRWSLDNSNPYIHDNYTVFNEAKLNLRKGTTFNIHKFAGIVTTEANELARGKELDHAKNVTLFAKGVGLPDLFQSHNEEWDEQFQETNVYIPSDELLTLAGRASLYHILANSRTNAKNLTAALSAVGLSSDSYGGMVFWDTDLWIIPGLLPFAPDTAKAISSYRNYTHDQAILNARQYDYEGASYPWTSGRFANCTSTGPCVDYEYHINVDIALSSWVIYLAGESEEYLEYTTWPLLRDAADFLSQYTKFNETLQQFVTHNMTDPDEYANHVDNAAFTNAGIDKILKLTIIVAKHLRKEINPRWIDVQGKIYIPRSESGVTLEYSHMNASISIKQADVVMLTFPLDYHIDDSVNQSILDLYWYSLKQADIGPAMTFPIYAIAARKLTHFGCSSQSYLQKSVLPYIRSPFAQFSEQADDNVLTNGGTHPAFPFLTAHGGYLQAIVYGLMGLTYSARINPETFRLEKYLKFDPVRTLALPGGVKISGFKYLHQTLDVIITDLEGIIVHHGDEPIQVEVNPRNEKAGNYTIEPNSKFFVPIFNPPLNMPGSSCECQKIANLTIGYPGEVPLSAIDGNNYTYWQPFDRGNARLLIDLGYPQVLDKGLIIWGSRPAQYLTIYGSEDISLSYEEVLLNLDRMNFIKLIDNLEVEVSEPFNELYLKEVKLLPNNETYFDIRTNRTILTRYVIVEVEGVIDDFGREGSTINEVALFAKQPMNLHENNRTRLFKYF